MADDKQSVGAWLYDLTQSYIQGQNATAAVDWGQFYSGITPAGNPLTDHFKTDYSTVPAFAPDSGHSADWWSKFYDDTRPWYLDPLAGSAKPITVNPSVAAGGLGAEVSASVRWGKLAKYMPKFLGGAAGGAGAGSATGGNIDLELPASITVPYKETSNPIAAAVKSVITKVAPDPLPATTSAGLNPSQQYDAANAGAYRNVPASSIPAGSVASTNGYTYAKQSDGTYKKTGKV